MIFATANNIPVFVLDKLNLLLELLKERKGEFEAFAGKIKDKWLRRTVLGLAQECNQYAHELLGQLEKMTGKVRDSDDDIQNLQDNTLLSEQDDIVQSCVISERKMIAAYRGILNEPILDENLRNLLRNQVNGIICAFMQLKLLKSSLVRG